ncbi:MAG: hypothetical protein SFU91_05045 [Chloroherpetonaceae bacterium]|nr:hypothetical protein [Chloroherpetonaceae bacterium]
MEIVNKTFDAVSMMRKIRDQIGYETETMSFIELKEYIRKKIEEDKSLNPKKINT